MSIIETHRCVTPKILKRYGAETKWTCECGKEWQLIMWWGEMKWFTVEYCLNLIAVRSFEPHWNDWFTGRKRPKKLQWDDEYQRVEGND